MNNAVSAKCRELYQYFQSMQQQGELTSLAVAEKALSHFGAKMEERNVIEFDFILGGRTYEERLYEYIIPLDDGTNSTFYVDKNLGFECGSKLPDQYKKVIKGMHVQFAGASTDKSQTNLIKTQLETMKPYRARTASNSYH